MDNQIKEEGRRQVSYASNVIMFLSEYIHGIINGKREDKNILSLRNAQDHFNNLIVSPDKPVPEQEDKWDGKCLICLIRKLGYKIRIDNFKHTCSLKDYDS